MKSTPWPATSAARTWRCRWSGSTPCATSRPCGSASRRRSSRSTRSRAFLVGRISPTTCASRSRRRVNVGRKSHRTPTLASQTDARARHVPCRIVDTGHVRELDLAIEVPPSELSAVCSNEQWGEVYERLSELIQSHRSTLVFVNTRRLAERVGHQPDRAARRRRGRQPSRQPVARDSALEPSSGSKRPAEGDRRHGVARDGHRHRLHRPGLPDRLAALDRHVPAARRPGGHALSARMPKGRLFPLTRDELLECLALVRAVRQRQARPHRDSRSAARHSGPADRRRRRLRRVGRRRRCSSCAARAWPYRDLARERLRRDRRRCSATASRRGNQAGRVPAPRPRSTAGCGPAAARGWRRSPPAARFPRRPTTASSPRANGTFVGTVNEDFAIESLAGDVFLLGNTSWRIRHVRGGEVIVGDAHGAPPTIPFWLGEAPGRTVELSQELSELRERSLRRCQRAHASSKCERVGSRSLTQRPSDSSFDQHSPAPMPTHGLAASRMRRRRVAAEQAVDYVAAQKAAVGLVPTERRDRLRAVLRRVGRHAARHPRAARARGSTGPGAWRCASASAAASISSCKPRPTTTASCSRSARSTAFRSTALFGMLNSRQRPAPARCRRCWPSPMFGVRWRWNVTRALAVLRQQRRQEGAAAPAAVPQPRTCSPAVFPDDRRLPGEPSRRRRDARSSARAADDARLPARGDGPRPLARAA